MSKTNTSSTGIVIGAVAIVAIALVAYFMIDIDQTREAKLPDVNVTVEGGQTPKFDAETGKVEVGTTEKTVTVPEVEVKSVEKSITVPTVNVEPAPAD